jgi:hypothetical protein
VVVHGRPDHHARLEAAKLFIRLVLRAGSEKAIRRLPAATAANEPAVFARPTRAARRVAARRWSDHRLRRPVLYISFRPVVPDRAEEGLISENVQPDHPPHEK